MKLHANARTCPNSRRLLVHRIEEEGWSLTKAAAAAGVSERSARKWLARWRAEGVSGLRDRSSAPKRIPHRTPPTTVDLIARLRRIRMTAAEIAEALELALSTVSVWLRRLGLGKRSRLSPPEPPNRYERARPGELVHVDVKRLGLRHLRTRSYRPRTNGKAERFIQTMLREWAYGRLYRKLRGAALPTRALAQPIQLPSQALLPRPSPAGSSLKRADREQPGYELQLARG